MHETVLREMLRRCPVHDSELQDTLWRCPVRDSVLQEEHAKGGVVATVQRRKHGPTAEQGCSAQAQLMCSLQMLTTQRMVGPSMLP